MSTFYSVAAYVNRHLDAGSRPDEAALGVLVTEMVCSDGRVTACIPWATTHGDITRDVFLEVVASRLTSQIQDRAVTHLEHPEYRGEDYRESGDFLSLEAAGIADALTAEVAGR